MSVLQKREWEWTARDRRRFIGMKAGARPHAGEGPPQDLPTAGWRPTRITLGARPARSRPVHEVTTENVFKQQLVPIQGQTDILTMGLPYICPYNVTR